MILESASRRCSEGGLWLDYEGNESVGPGWTNFSSCFSPEFWKRIAEEANKTGKSDANLEQTTFFILKIKPEW